MPKYIKINYDQQELKLNMLIINYAIKLTCFFLSVINFALND